MASFYFVWIVMTFALNTFSSALRPMFPLIGTIANHGTKKLPVLVKNLFNIMQWSFLSFYGGKEILFDRVRDIRKIKKKIILVKAERINHYLNHIFVKKEAFIGRVKFNVVHGSLYVAAGVAGAAAAIHKQGWFDLGSFAFPLETLGNSFFCLASLVSLIQNIRIYREACKVPEYAPLHMQEAASILKKSALLGMISSINYMIATALLMMNVAATFALIFGCIAVFTGFLKIFYDFIRLKHAY